MQHSDYQDQIVWIIGASSGIGAALAQELSVRGATLALSARRQAELEVLNATMSDRHGVYPLDVTDAAQVQRVAQAIHSQYDRIDRVIILAAAYTPMRLDALELQQAQQIVTVNVTGTINVLHALYPLLHAQTTRPQIALCGSVAGYTGLPGGQPYSATKAAIINLAESLHAEWGAWCDVKLINPGFVRTPLTDKNTFAMPMMITPTQAAQAIAKGLLSRRFEVHFPRGFTILLKLLRLLPYPLTFALTRRMRG